MKVVNYRNTPFLRLIIPFCIGLALADHYPLQHLNASLGIALALLLMLFVAAGLTYEYASRWLFGSLLQLALVTLGYIHLHYQQELYRPDHFSHATDTLSQPIRLRGMIADAPIRGERTKVLLRVYDLYAHNDSLNTQASGNLLMYVKADSLVQRPLKYGDEIMVQAQPIRVLPPANPNSFDYRNYLHHQDIHYTAFVGNEAITLLDTAQGYWVWAQAFAYRDRLLDVLQRHFPVQDEYAVASALLVGYKEDLSDEVKKAYADTGSMHALAVSGTHVGLLYVGLLFLLKRLPLNGRRGRIIETLLALVAIWAFTFLTGATASVLRASVMFSVYLVGKMAFRQTHIWNVLSASAFGLLVWNPHLLFDAGFQLSYAAVAGMAFFYPSLLKVSPLFKYQWLNEGWKILLVGVAAQIGTLPLSLYYFHQFPCYFWLAGWIVVLGGAVFLWAGSLLIVLDWAIPGIAYWLGLGLSYLLMAMNKMIYWIQAIPGSVVSGIWVPGWGALVLYVIIGLLGSSIALRQKWGLQWASALLFVLCSLYAYRGIAQQQRLSIQCYNIKKSTLIDVFDGRKRLSIGEGVVEKQETFGAQGNRWANGSTHTTGEWLPIASDTSLGHIQVRQGIIQNGPLRLVIVDTALPLPDTTKAITAHALLLRKNAPVTLADCLAHCATPVVIADQSNSKRQRAAWKKEAEQLGVQWVEGSYCVE